MAIFFVEQSTPPAALLDVQADLQRARTMTDGGDPLARVRVLQAAYVPAREACVSFIDGADQDTVCAVLTRAGVRARVLPAVALG